MEPLEELGGIPGTGWESGHPSTQGLFSPQRWAPRLSTRGCQLPPGTPSPACPPKASVATGRPRKNSPGVRDPRASWKGSCPSLGVVQGGEAHLLSPRGGALAPPGGSDMPAQAQGAAWNLRSMVGASSIPFAIPAGGAGVTCDGCRGTQLGEAETLARSPGARVQRGRPGCTACVQSGTHRFIHPSAPAVIEPAASRRHARDSAVHGGQCNTGGWVTEGLPGHDRGFLSDLACCTFVVRALLSGC